MLYIYISKYTFLKKFQLLIFTEVYLNCIQICSNCIRVSKQIMMVNHPKVFSNLSSRGENRDWKIVSMKQFDSVTVRCQFSLVLSRSMTSWLIRKPRNLKMGLGGTIILYLLLENFEVIYGRVGRRITDTTFWESVVVDVAKHKSEIM